MLVGESEERSLSFLLAQCGAHEDCDVVIPRSPQLTKSLTMHTGYIALARHEPWLLKLLRLGSCLLPQHSLARADWGL